MLVQVKKFEEKRITGIWIPKDWIYCLAYGHIEGLEDDELTKVDALCKQVYAIIGEGGRWGTVLDEGCYPELLAPHENITGIMCDCVECYYSVLEEIETGQVNIGV